MPLKYPRDMMIELLDAPSTGEVVPSAKETILALVDGIFFASLMVEEGEPVRVAVVHEEGGCAALEQLRDSEREPWGEEGPPSAWDVVPIEPRKFTPKELAKLSVGMAYGEQLAVVSGRSPNLLIEGIARRKPQADGGRVMRIAAPRPGVLVFEEADRELLRFEAGEKVSVALDLLHERGPVLDAVESIIRIKDAPSLFKHESRIVTQLLKVMKSHGHGAILAVLPHSEMPPDVGYKLSDPSLLNKRVVRAVHAKQALFNLYLRRGEEFTAEDEEQATELRREAEEASAAVDATLNDLGRLSAMDGALLIGPELAVLGAGYMVAKSDFGQPVRAVPESTWYELTDTRRDEKTNLVHQKT